MSCLHDAEATDVARPLATNQKDHLVGVFIVPVTPHARSISVLTSSHWWNTITSINYTYNICIVIYFTVHTGMVHVFFNVLLCKLSVVFASLNLYKMVHSY